MSLTTLPRHVLALEYRLFRFPTQILATRVVARYLADDNPGRLGFERTLGVVDGYAGQVLGDERLTARGDALRRRVELLAEAEALSARATAQREQSTAELRGRETAARRDREQAVNSERDEIRKARERADAAKAQARQRAEDEARDAAKRAEQTKKRTVDTARRTAERRTSAITDRTQRATAAPKAQLKQAGQAKSAAQQQREDAKALAGLSARERSKRKSG